jgi:ATP-binding cassette subfamily C (CFTR/MRP) protein 1
VLEAGQVKEFGTPRELLERKGMFWGLVREAGLLGETNK